MNDQFAPSPLAGRRRPAGWLFAGTILTVIALLVGIATAGSSIWAAVSSSSQSRSSSGGSTVTETEQQSHPRAAAHLEVDAPAGDVTVLAGSPQRVEIERTLRWSGARPTISETWSSDTLRIVTGCPTLRPWGNQVCEVDQIVQAPPGIAATVQTDAGDIEVRGIDGALSLSTAAGAITITDVTGPVSARSSAGDISGTGLRSPSVEVRLDAGAARLRFDVAPERVSVDVAAGSIVIEVPPGDSYRVQVDTTVGTQQVEVVQDPGAERLIEARTDVGQVRVRYTS